MFSMFSIHCFVVLFGAKFAFVLGIYAVISLRFLDVIDTENIKARFLKAPIEYFSGRHWE